MEFKEFKKTLFNKAKENDFTKYELYYTKNTSLDVLADKSEIENYSLNTTLGVSFRGIFNGKMGYSYTEKLDEESINMLIEKAKECAKLTENSDKDFIFSGKLPYKKLNLYDNKIANLNAQSQINNAITLSLKPIEIDKEITKTAYNSFNTAKTERIIINSEGINLKEEKTLVEASLNTMAKDGENIIFGGAVTLSTKLSDINIDNLINKSINQTLRKKGASPVTSGKYKTLIACDAMASLLNTMKNNFLGNIADDGKTLLKDKVGEKVASDKVNIIDDPFLDGGISSCSFDDEGMPTKVNSIIKDGVFKGFLHSLKTSKKVGVNSTGNGFKDSIKSPVKVSTTNLYMKNGNNSFNELLSKVDNGLYITELTGLHSGASYITGDFSLGCEGFLIENGKLTKSIKQITVAGNFFALLKDIEEIGNDLKESGVTSGIGSPSVIIKELSIAGE